jgi:hypothetical protein
MTISDEFFTGFMNGWLLGLSFVDFVMPVGLILWTVLLHTLPLYNLNRDHTIGGFIFSIYFAGFGIAICLGAPIISGIDYSFRVDFLVCVFLIGLSLFRWNKKIFANMALEAAKVGENNGNKKTY